MALNLTQSFEFADHKVGNPAGDILDLTINFFNGDVDETLQAADFDIRVLKWGTIEHSYNIDDLLLVPAVLRMEFYDGQGALYSRFFPDPSESQTEDYEREAEIIVRVNGTVEFQGDVILESIEAEIIQDEPYLTSKIRLSAAVRTSLLNNTRAYDDDDGDNDGALGDQLGYAGSNTLYQTLEQYLIDLYELMGTTLTGSNVEIVNHWTFHGLRISGGGAGAEDFNGLNAIELRSGPMFYNYDSAANIQSAADILRNLALCFGSFTGVIHKTRVFFHQLFAYDFDNTQTLGDVQRIRTCRPYNRLNYVKVEAAEDYDRVSIDTPYTAGTKEPLDDNKLEIDLITYAWDDTAGSPISTIEADGITNVGSRYRIDEITWSELQAGQHDHTQFVADYWYLRRRYSFAVPPFRVDKFIGVQGLGYDFLKKFTYTINGTTYRYQIIKLKRNLDTGLSDIDAINLGSSAGT